MKTTLTVELDYDPEMTDPEGLASAMDRLLETVLSTPGIVEEYGDPKMGEFFVAAKTTASPKPRVVLNTSGGVLQDVFASDPAVTVVLCDWDCNGAERSESGIVDIPDGRGGTRLAAVTEYPVSPLTDLAGTETGAALKAAGLSWDTQSGHATEVVRRWVIYNPDTDSMVTTRVYESYDEACENAAQVNDVLVLPLLYEDLQL